MIPFSGSRKGCIMGKLTWDPTNRVEKNQAEGVIGYMQRRGYGIHDLQTEPTGSVRFGSKPSRYDRLTEDENDDGNDRTDP